MLRDISLVDVFPVILILIFQLDLIIFISLVFVWVKCFGFWFSLTKPFSFSPYIV